MYTTLQSKDDNPLQELHRICSNDSVGSLRDPLDDQRQLVGGTCSKSAFTSSMHNHNSSTNQNTSAYDPELASDHKTTFAVNRSTDGSVEQYNIAKNSEPASTLISFADSEMGDNTLTDVRIRKAKRAFPSTNCEKILLALVATLTFLFLLFLLLFIRQKLASESICTTINCVETSQKILSSMNFSADPCDDFYSYACGNWIAVHHIPPGTNSWTVFSELGQTAEYFSKELLEDASILDESRGLELAHVYYKSCMNEQAIDKRGLTPIKKVISQLLGGWRLLPSEDLGARSDPPGEDPFAVGNYDLTSVVGKFLRFGHGTDIFQMLIEKDPKNSTRFAITLASGEVSMMPEFYFEDKDPKIVKVRYHYRQFMKKYAQMLGVAESDMNALDDIFELETQMAKNMEPRARQSIETNFFKMNMTELKTYCPVLEWTRLFDDLFSAVNYTITDAETVIIGDKEYFEKRCKVYQDYLQNTTSIKILHDVSIWRLLWSTIIYMPSSVRKESESYEQANSGIKEQPQRWSSCVRNTEEFFGMTIARRFVAEQFNVQSKEMATAMIRRIKMAFKNSFFQVDWMDEEAKNGAEEKVDLMEDSIGYPDDINDINKENKPFENVEALYNDTFLDNSLVLARSKTLILLMKLFNDSLKTWDMAPHIVNAFYSPRENHIYFPAGILQKPFYDADYPLALNYGGIGVVVGHEIVHAFDRQGSKYDAKGNLRQWWSESTRTDFEKNNECMIHQYGNYTVQGKNVDGHLTLSENIADNGGLKAAYRAFQKLKNEEGPTMNLPGLNLTMNQLFFISFAQVWCKRQLPQAALHTVMFDVHAPERYRVIGTLSNSEEFAQAFECPRGSVMNPRHKCVLW